MENLFDNLKKGISIAKNEAGRFTKVVVNKSTNIVDTTKLNLSLNEAEVKINKLYTKIGELVFDEYTNGTEFNIEISDACEKIGKFNEEIGALKDQIATLKNNVKCNECGEYNNAENEFCSKCGARIHPEEDTVTPDDVIDVIPSDSENSDADESYED